MLTKWLLKDIKHTTSIPKIIRWYMNKRGFEGMAMGYGTIYYISEGYLSSESLRKHELMHIEQMRREGIIKFLIKYFYYSATRGYWNNPYEISAREAENK